MQGSVYQQIFIAHLLGQGTILKLGTRNIIVNKINMISA